VRIEDVLSDGTLTTRLVCFDKWLVWDGGYWEVYQQKYHQRVKKLITTEMLDTALRVLTRRGD
jgi:hypothetical protein